ncbi:hypothetical protein DM01DRAFT_1337947 [Hesseltinella vesiculosa]|uniref:Glutathione S-transferase n=1 Tax=Hesseltinella vesiculosa TaxID=101127 RepID=A0A1X2GB85_9FUNG|nr:hypothetical protein DM01DRAFT_1337947 [Hesseltinella vesiculosa]
MAAQQLTIIGAHMSTYTRTIRMALNFHGVTYKHIPLFPHTEELKKYTPFGKVPVMLLPGHPKPVLESNVMRVYIDGTYGSALAPSTLEQQMKMTLLISILQDQLFPHVILGVTKVRLFAEKKGTPEAEIVKRLEQPLEKAEKIITYLESLVADTRTQFLCGDQVSWADLYLYPCMDDLFSLPEAEKFKQWAPTLLAWHGHFKANNLAQETISGTVAETRASL